MPNWCTNIVQVIGTKPDVSGFESFVRTRTSLKLDFDFNQIIPCPTGVKCPSEGNCSAEVHEDLWGVKWNLNPEYDKHSLIGKTDWSRIYKFETAWSSPIKIYKALLLAYPEVLISWFYQELNMSGQGYLSLKEVDSLLGIKSNY